MRDHRNKENRHIRLELPTYLKHLELNHSISRAFRIKYDEDYVCPSVKTFLQVSSGFITSSVEAACLGCSHLHSKRSILKPCLINKTVFDDLGAFGPEQGDSASTWWWWEPRAAGALQGLETMERHAHDWPHHTPAPPCSWAPPAGRTAGVSSQVIAWRPQLPRERTLRAGSWSPLDSTPASFPLFWPWSTLFSKINHNCVWSGFFESCESFQGVVGPEACTGDPKPHSKLTLENACTLRLYAYC